MDLKILTKCELCGSEESAIITPINEFYNSHSCLACGFTTNDLMVKDSEFDFEEYEAEMPELYKDIKQVDDLKNRVWYPMTINKEDKGTIFANGTSMEDWQWSAIKTVELTTKEKKDPKFKGKKYKSDSSTMQSFGIDFFSAADYIGLFDLPQDEN